jgi:hypothetical protein
LWYVDCGVNNRELTTQEYHENKNDIIIEDTELQQTVHLYGLKKCVVRIGGKVNAISLGKSPE